LPALSQSGAVEYCQSINGRLPSADEFRELMMAQCPAFLLIGLLTRVFKG
jgi:hypothetical protein